VDTELDNWTRARATALRLAYVDCVPGATVEGFAASLAMSPGAIYKWQRQPNGALWPTTQRLLAEFLQGSSERVRTRFFEILATQGDVLSGSLSDRNRDPLQPVVTDTVGLFATAAHEVVDDVVTRSGDSSDALLGLQERVVAAARSYADRSPLVEFADVRNLRDIARKLDSRAQRPAERSDLFVVFAETTALMGSVAFDLGFWPDAAAMAAAATKYATWAGHSSLIAWALGLEATLAFWSGRTTDAVELIERGLMVAPRGKPRFRLHHIAARVHAVRGDRASVIQALDLAMRERAEAEGRRDPLHDEIGGEFAFDTPRASACAAAAWLAVRNGDQAEAHAREALGLYAALPGHLQLAGPMHGCQIDLAAARILQADLDGAQAIVEPIFALPVDRRTVSLAGRLTTVRRLLHDSAWSHEASASRLSDGIVDWCESVHGAAY
jgi:hypothetical protein